MKGSSKSQDVVADLDDDFEQLYFSNQFNQMIHLSEEVLKDEESSEIEKFLSRYWRYYILRKQGKRDQAVVNLSRLIDDLLKRKGNSPDYIYLLLRSRNLLAYTLLELNNLEDSIDTATMIIKCMEEQDDLTASRFLSEYGYALNTLGVVYKKLKETEKSKDYFIKSMNIYEKAENYNRYIQPLSNLITSLHKEDDNEIVEILHSRITGLSDEVINTKDIGKCLQELGTIEYRQKGDLTRAMQYFKEALDIFNKTESMIGKIDLLNSLGVIHFERGLVDKAEDYYNQALDIGKTLGQKHIVPMLYVNLGYVYLEKNQYDLAYSIVSDALEIIDHIKFDRIKAECLFLLVRIELIRGNIPAAQSINNKLQEYVSTIDNLRSLQFSILSEGLIFMQSKRSFKIVQAQQNFERIIQDDMMDFNITVTALKSLTYLLIEELVRSGDLDIIKEIEPHISNLQQISTKNNSYSILVETIVLKSKLSLLQLNYAKSQKLLDKALEIAEKYRLHHLSMKTSFEIDSLKDEMQIWEELGTELTVEDIIQFSGISRASENYLKTRKLNEPEIPKETPINFMIISGNGLAIYSYSFQEQSMKNDMLLSNLLTAIASLAQEVFDQNLRRVFVGEYSILMKFYDNVTYCYTFKGSSYHAVSHLTELVSRMSKQDKIRTHLSKDMYVKHTEGRLKEHIDRLVDKTMNVR